MPVTGIICFSGNRNGMDPHDGMANAEAGLAHPRHAEKRGVMLVMELCSNLSITATTCATTPAWGVELCQRLGSDNSACWYDIYHMQIMEGDIIATIGKHHACFKHYHRRRAWPA